MKNTFSKNHPILLTLIAVATLNGFTSAKAQDDDGAFLDPAYKNIPHVIPQASHSLTNGILRPFDSVTRVKRSDILSVIAEQSPVRSQGARGTCSIFSATALLESLMISFEKANPEKIDLSEEWLEYVKDVDTDMDGSSSSTNISMFRKYGMPTEETFAYIGETWEKLTDSTLARERCGKVGARYVKTCLRAHRNPLLLAASDEELSTPRSKFYDPEFLNARKEASEHLESVTSKKPAYNYVFSEDEVKAYLTAGTPVLLDVDFYYGAWNHRKAPDFGIERSLENWALGIVGYPEVGSVDRVASKKESAGHSILLVGYDDDEEVTITTKMEDGSHKTFTYKGVYYFKNSWGTANFGANMEIDGKKEPGYGKITQKYARDFGGFYVWDWNKSRTR